MSEQWPHTPIMVDEVLNLFEGCDLRVFYEGTIGAGGHAEAILEAHPEIERYIACDRDPEALEIAKRRLSRWEGKMEWVHGNFANLDHHLEERGVEAVDGFFLT